MLVDNHYHFKDYSHIVSCHNCGKKIKQEQALWSWLPLENGHDHYFDILKYYVPYCSEKCKIADEL